jgi:hypothetical protein
MASPSYTGTSTFGWPSTARSSLVSSVTPPTDYFQQPSAAPSIFSDWPSPPIEFGTFREPTPPPSARPSARETTYNPFLRGRTTDQTSYIREPTSPIPDERFQGALNIENYFDLIEYCEHNHLTVCEDPEFWREKYIKDFGTLTLYGDISKLHGPQLKAIYQAALSEKLNQLTQPKSAFPSMNKGYKRIYGKDKDDLANKARELRKEANKAFPMEYDKRLYEATSGRPDAVNFKDIENGVGTVRPGQLIIVSDNVKGLDGASVYYIYQIGNRTEIAETQYPNFPKELFEDTPRGQIRRLYGINPNVEKI